MTTTDWNPVLRGEFDEPYWRELQAFVTSERAAHTVYPPRDEVFAALHLTPLADVRVVILGQDPYHGPRQAHGLAFSVRRGVRIPPSLRNIHQELRDDVGVEPPDHGNLEAWARRGVLLLNTSLTVRAGQAASHSGKGWETFTDRVISTVASSDQSMVFILWGNHARQKKSLIVASAAGDDPDRHSVIESTHPSPFAARNGFFGSRPFSRANEALVAAGRTPVDWSLDADPASGSESNPVA
ncbi:MAG: uracil-DNA glycosylase [Ilumatobacter sp.]|uniref:uracil-DNA glycosylase n=1 Tax=Ilumatobacter sp. TaxID=1967498 RepID=UPI003296BEFC